jgi:hypothetical protein
LAAVGAAIAVLAENLDSAAEDTVTADLLGVGVAGASRAAAASLNLGGSGNGSSGHGEDGGDSGELHFED